MLKTEGAVLAIRIRQNGTRITQFDERSAGLKMFVALVAFLEVRGYTTPPVLLIDEAETHLHIDAQADLVNTFMTQRQAAKIIYTTHSPACLPPDLGSNIRAVVPDPDHEYRSLIRGSFWDGAAGFSPLMLAMGAGQRRSRRPATWYSRKGIRDARASEPHQEGSRCRRP